MTLYELNQMGYENLPKMTKAEIEQSKEVFKQLIEENPGTYYMLLNHDIRYFTLFVKSEKTSLDNFINEIYSILKPLGTLKSIELNKYKAIEIWIDNHCFLFFNYDKGVVEVNE